MKKNLIYLLVFLILLGVAGWLISNRNTNSTLEGEANYSFSVPDTGALKKIVIQSKDPHQSVLERRSSGWTVNGDYPVRKGAMETLLETLHDMELRRFLPQRLHETVMKNMMVYGKKVELYKGDKPYRTFFVGTSTPDQLGTYMMMKNGDAPYAVHIQGFNGFLETRFIAKPHLWRKREIFTIDPSVVKEIRMTYPDSLEASFELRMFSSDSLYFRRASDQKVIHSINKTKAQLFKAALRDLSYESLIQPDEPAYRLRDSLLATPPLFRLTVKDTRGNTQELSGYRIKAEEGTVDPKRPQTQYDPDRMHGFIDGKEMVLLQYYGLRNVLLPLNHFRNESPETAGPGSR